MSIAPPCDLLLIAGTRPEALKLAPLAQAWRGSLRWCWTGQQPEVPADAAHWPWQRLPPPAHPLRRGELDRTLQMALAVFLHRCRPRAVVVQGDTASAHAGAQAARAAGLPLVHLEAGLRSGDLRSPFPEEPYRRAIARIADLHLAPSARAAAQLLAEGVPAQSIEQIGSTAVDGLRQPALASTLPRCDLLVDVHRRENAGRALDRLALGLRALARGGWRIGMAAHPNAWWRRRWSQALGEDSGIARLPALERSRWLALARNARGVLSDSGGAAEELPYLGVPLLVYRRRSERMEALESGHARQIEPLAAGELDAQIERALGVAHWPPAWPLAADSPYGDGHAGLRAAEAIARWLALQQQARLGARA